MSMNVLLVESHYRTRYWFKAMQGLANIYIVSVMPEEKRLFISEGGVPQSNILDLHNPNLEKYEFSTSAKYLRDVEVEMGVNINEIVLMDRTLRKKQYEYIVKYCHYVIKEVVGFIKDKDPKLVFIEPTWTHELIIAKICDFFNIPVLAPVKDKILSDRIFMFYGIVRNKYFIRHESVADSMIEKEVLHALNGKKKPQYFEKLSNRNKFKLSKFKPLYDITRLAVLRLKNDNIQPGWFSAVGKKFISILRARFFSYRNRFVELKDVPLPYVLITLHVQPEAGIDVVGAKFSNQIEFVRQVARTAPADRCILVKEHPHDFGRRTAQFYQELYSIPNVLVLGPYVESRGAIGCAELVISTAGTSSLEAALAGIPAVTAVEMYFNELMVTPSFDPTVDRLDELLELAEIWKERFSYENVKKVMLDIEKNSFPGNAMDFKFDPNVKLESNVKKLRDAFSEIINTFESSGKK